jgi:uncharacterized membrane protein
MRPFRDEGQLVDAFSLLDGVAFAAFVSAWLGYHWLVEGGQRASVSLNGRMNAFRHAWMLTMAQRDARIVDTTIMASLQNGTAFFASTSLLAIGAALTLLQSVDTAVKLYQDIPFVMPTSRVAWEIKVIGLTLILVYAFFKFSWAYRLFNYAAILLGATPTHKGDANMPEVTAAAARAARMATVAGTHFNRGQRAFFFALAYLGWFLGPIVFIAATVAAFLVMWRRQFASDALSAISDSAGV